MKKYKIAIDNYIGLDGWYLDYSFRGRNGYEDRKRKIINKLSEKGLHYNCYDENHIRVYEFDYNEDYDNIVQKDLELLEIIDSLDL